MRILRFIFFPALFLFFCSITPAQDFAAFVRTGELARQRGEFGAAIENFSKAKDAAIKTGDKSEQAQSCNLVGEIYYSQAKYNSAIRAFREAEKLAVETGDKREEARAWAFLGQLYWRVGKVEDGDMLLNDALEVFEKLNDELNTALTLRFIGRMEDGFRKNENTKTNAFRHLERSLEISRRIGDEEGELTTLKEMGLTFQTIDPVQGLSYKALAYFEPLRARLQNSNYRRLYAIVLNNIANNNSASSQFKKAIETADEAAKIFRQINDRQELREVLDRKAQSLLALYRFEEALPVIEESIKIADDLYNQQIGDELDRSRYFESLIISYRIKRAVLSELKRPAAMFETQEAMRSLSLREMINRRRNDKKRELTIDEAAEEKRLNNDLNALNRQILNIRQTDKSANFERTKLDRQLQKARLALEEWQANIASENEQTNPPNRAENLNIAQLCALIPDDDTAVTEYEAAKSDFGFIFVMVKNDTDFSPPTLSRNILTEKIALPDGQNCTLKIFYNKNYSINSQDWQKELRGRISEFREQISQNSPAFKENAKFLYETLINDSMPFIKDRKHLIIVPSGLVCDVPFQALISENGRYLIEDFSISYAPSLTTLAEMNKNRQRLADFVYDGDFLAFGNPRLSAETVAKLRSRYRDGKLESLPEAETEVRKIGAFYQSSKILTGKNATEEQWRGEAANYRYLHLATHGLSDPEKPLYSHVLLSPDADDDGLIEGREIAGMKLNAEMVVLSACETARGRNIDGEGMVGLAWSFAAAGVPTILASNWKVDSSSTTDLMIDFYSKLNGKNALSKAEALRQASIDKIRNKTTANPFYWAGFNLFGDWKK